MYNKIVITRKLTYGFWSVFCWNVKLTLGYHSLCGHSGLQPHTSWNRPTKRSTMPSHHLHSVADNQLLHTLHWNTTGKKQTLPYIAVASSHFKAYMYRDAGNTDNTVCTHSDPLLIGKSLHVYVNFIFLLSVILIVVGWSSAHWHSNFCVSCSVIWWKWANSNETNPPLLT